MRVVDNLLIGAPGRLIPRRADAAKAIAELAGPLGLSLDLKADVGSLTVGERQQLELLRLLWLGARVLILDEPTTGISAVQRDQLFDTLRQLAAQGKSVLFVSHKLEEVQDLCTRAVILRRGRLIGETLPPFKVSELVSMMFEREVTPGKRRSCATEKPLLRLEGMSVEHGRIKLEPLDFDIHEGETIGLAGMDGSGQNVFLRACAGLIPTTGGTHPAGRQRPHRQELPPVQEEGRGLRARGPAGGGPHPGAHAHRALPAHPEEARLLHRPGEGPPVGRGSHRRVQHQGHAGQPGGSAVRRQPAEGAPGSHAPGLPADAAGAAHPGPRHRVGHLPVDQAEGALQPGRRDRLHLERPGRAAPLQRPHPGLLRRAHHRPARRGHHHGGGARLSDRRTQLGRDRRRPRRGRGRPALWPERSGASEGGSVG